MFTKISGMLMLRLTLLTTADRRRDERGDVPGWVMVTLMTALVIAAIMPLVRTQLTSMLQTAFDMVRNS